MKVTLNIMRHLSEELSFEEQLKEICNQYKDGYVEPPKEIKPWRLRQDRIYKELYGVKPIVWIPCPQKKDG